MNKRSKKAESIKSDSTLTEDYSSAVDLDSSDLEFYDVSDDEPDSANFDLVLREVDLKLDGYDLDELNDCLDKLENLCIEFPENPHLLWRIGRAYYKLSEKTDDEELIKDYTTKGVEACNSALKLKPELAEVHKYLAILIGSRSDYQPMKERILDGHLFKKHVDEAIKLNPQDPHLHHMLGRFAYEISELKWWVERKQARF